MENGLSDKQVNHLRFNTKEQRIVRSNDLKAKCVTNKPHQNTKPKVDQVQ